MSRHHSHIASAIKIIDTCKAGEPLAHHLKKFFAADKKYGSKDRKAISSLCYNFYRLGKALPACSIEERILAAVFLCNTEGNELLAALQPAYHEKIKLGYAQKCSFLRINEDELFPLSSGLSEQIDKGRFIKSFLHQPLFYLRLRPGKALKVQEKLTAANIAFTEITNNCIALQPAIKIEELLTINKEAVVQDRSSQQVFNFLLQDDIYLPAHVNAWDCCAASGGKSILLYDILQGNVQFTVTDIRENILHNLKNRFADAGIKKYKSFVADLSQNATALFADKFDLIICDAPCTGSGTWARTPEQVVFFTENQIKIYAQQQEKIASSALQYLKDGALFFYITCSVFAQENEDITAQLLKKNTLTLLHSEYIEGYDMAADTMYVAVMKK